MTATFATPAGPLPAPQRTWIPQRGHYLRQRCAYCTHPSYEGAADIVGNFFCKACITRHGWAVTA